MASIESILVPALNHLLDGEPWAVERLRSHSGARLQIEAGPLVLALVINAQGQFSPCDTTSPALVTITLPADLPVKLMVDRDNLFSSVRLSGSADLAETLAFVFRNLRWDAEGDLARLVGDIPARRTLMTLRDLSAHCLGSARRVVDNVSEYIREDSGLLVNQLEIGSFGSEINRLRDDLARLEKRVASL